MSQHELSEEQAREGLRAAYHAWWSDQTPISVVLAAEEKLIAAVRAERDAAWREGVAADAARYRVLADKSGRWFCQADGMDAWYFSGPVVTLTADMPTMNEYVDALAARMEAK